MSTPRLVPVSPVAQEAAESLTPAPPNKGGRRRLLGAALAVVLLGGGGTYLVTHRGLESTDNAQIDADLTAVPARTGGVVEKVLFNDNQNVKAGEVLVELDQAPARARLAQAEATLATAEANALSAEAEANQTSLNATSNRSATAASARGARLSISSAEQQISEGRARLQAAETTAAQARSDAERATQLYQKGALSRAQYDQQRTTAETTAASVEQARASLMALISATDQARSRAEEASARARQASDVDTQVAQAQARAKAARAQVEQAKAARDLAALELSYTKVTAPQDGVISKKSVTLGQMLPAGTAVGQLVPQQSAWVTANFKETQIGHMRVGQPAEVKIDAYPDVVLHGEVESFSAATGARFTLLPPDNATGNFTKVTQRMAVRVRLRDVPPQLPLRPGMSVELTVNTR